MQVYSPVRRWCHCKHTSMSNTTDCREKTCITSGHMLHFSRSQPVRCPVCVCAHTHWHWVRRRTQTRNHGSSREQSPGTRKASSVVGKISSQVTARSLLGAPWSCVLLQGPCWACCCVYTLGGFATHPPADDLHTEQDRERQPASSCLSKQCRFQTIKHKKTSVPKYLSGPTEDKNKALWEITVNNNGSMSSFVNRLCCVTYSTSPAEGMKMELALSRLWL